MAALLSGTTSVWAAPVGGNGGGGNGVMAAVSDTGGLVDGWMGIWHAWNGMSLMCAASGPGMGPACCVLDRLMLLLYSPCS